MKGFDNAIKAVKFVHTHKYWTVKDLYQHLGINKNSAYRIINALGNHYPIRIVRTIKNGRGTKPALYTIRKEFEKPSDVSRLVNEKRKKAISELKKTIAMLEDTDL